MNKSQRLIDLMITINSRRRFTLRELSEEFQVSKRTIQRDLNDLEELGFPLYSELGVHGGFQVLPNRLLPPISLTTEEAVSIFFASQMLRFYRSLPFENEMLSTLNKFTHLLPEDTKERIEQLKQRLLFWVPTNTVDSPFLDDLLKASLNQNVITITYESETGVTTRNIQPIGIYAMNGYWYCPAFCFSNNEMRSFRADRIKQIQETQLLPKSDIAKRSIEDYLNNSLQGDDLNLVVKLARRGVVKCKADFWLSEGLSEHEDGTGILRRKMSSQMVPWVVSYFVGIGSDAFVQEPIEVVSAIKKHIRQIASLYE